MSIETKPGEADPPADLPLAVAVIVRRDDLVLLIRRAPTVPLPGYWTPITGRLEPGESLTDAAHREVLEEVGLPIALGPELVRGPTSDGRFLLVYFTATSLAAPDHPLTLAAAEVAEARWLSHADALALEPMLPRTRAVLTELFASPAR
ncbi:MAG: NUDIX hydrolase [Deltaproteobacteria bacterium]|nr:NUDIX hydrolase [Deltaproteobacteria bacterium]